MKKLFFVASMMMLSLGAFAQHEVGTLTLQPKVGVNIANMSETDNADPRIGFAVGGEFEYQAEQAYESPELPQMADKIVYHGCRC
jgi:hypothetical protein